MLQQDRKYIYMHGVTNSGKRYTLSAIIFISKNITKFGWALCSLADNFCKKTGRNIANRRAIHDEHMILAGTDYTNAATILKLIAKQFEENN